MTETYFERFSYFAHAPSLEPIRVLTAALGHPERSLRFVHVAGTNGKGSITTMTAEIARAAGYRVGLYTSPYIVRFHERIRIDGVPVSDEMLGRALEKVAPAIDALEADGWRFAHFDVVTAAALLCFAEAGCQLVCWETGLGGRCDATNVIPAESLLCAVIVPIGFDHCGVLGNTLAEIAGEKAGIIKENAEVVISPKQPDEVMGVLYGYGAQMNATLRQPSLSTLRELAKDPLHPRFSYAGAEYTLSLLGGHQYENAITAMEVAGVLRRKGFGLTEAQIREGLARAVLPARLQVAAEKPLVLVDGAHNPHGASALAGFLKQLAGSVSLVMGVCADKDVDGILAVLAPLAKKVFTVPVPNPRSLSPAELAVKAQKAGTEAVACGSLDEAMTAAKELVGEDGAVVVCGSLYLCGGFLAETETAV